MTRELVDNYFDVERGIYRVLILFANYDTTVDRVRANAEDVIFGASEIPPDKELDRLERDYIHFWPVASVGTHLLKRRDTKLGR